MRLGTKFILIIIISFAVLYYMSIVNFNGFVKITDMSFTDILDINAVTIISDSFVIVDSKGILYCLGSLESNQLDAVLVAAKLINVNVRQVTMFPFFLGLVSVFIIMCINLKKNKNDSELGAVLKLFFGIIIFTFLVLWAMVSLTSNNDNSFEDSYVDVDKTLTKDHYIIKQEEILLGVEIEFISLVDIDNATILIEFYDSNKNIVKDDEINIFDLDKNVIKTFDVKYDFNEAFSFNSYRIVVTGEIK